MRPGLHRARHVRNGAIGLSVIAALLYAGYSRSIPLWPKGGDVVTAEFADAANVRGGQEVRIRGIKVGTVESVRRDGRVSAVRMRLTEHPRPELRADARAHVFWRTLLGRNMYVELEPGRAAGRLSGPIPASRTTTQVELDQALEPLDGDGRQALRTMLGTLRDGLADPAATRLALDRTPPAMAAVAAGASALRGEREGDLAAVVDRTARVMTALDRGQQRLAGLIDGAAVTLGVTAARRADLADLLQRTPAALAHTRAQMGGLRSTLGRLDPLVDSARPGARRHSPAVADLAPALRAATPVVRAAEPLLADLRPAVRRLRSAGRAGTPLVAALDPTIERLADDLLPWLGSVDPHTHRRVYELIGPTFATVDSLAEAYDSNGHDISFQAGISTRSGGGLLPCELLLTDPTTTEKLRCSGLSAGLAELLGQTPPSRARSHR
jgi:virulence factor Mce-like protein